jgi:hypothetical protein
MDRNDLREVLREQPFEPIEVGLTDGRSILVRHPDQVIVTHRKAIFGLAQIKNGRKHLRTPDNDDRLVKDWLMIDLLHVVSAEPVAGRRPKRRGVTRRKKKP